MGLPGERQMVYARPRPEDEMRERVARAERIFDGAVIGMVHVQPLPGSFLGRQFGAHGTSV